MSNSRPLSVLLPPPKHAINASAQHKSGLKELVGLLSEAGNPRETLYSVESFQENSVTLESFLPLRHKYPDLKIPQISQSDIQNTYERTKAVFDKILSQKLQPQGTGAVGTANKGSAKTIEYKLPDQNSEVRKLKIVDQQVDPLQPKLFKTKKVVAPSTDEPFAPVLHKSDDITPQSTKEERDKWNIPSAISSWKNPNGYTINLDRRIASDGRYSKESLGPHEISEGHMKLSEALDAAERKAREEVSLRADAKRMLAEQDVREKEEKLRMIALKAREDRKKNTEPYSGPRALDSATRQRQEDQRERLNKIRRELQRSKMSTAERLRALATGEGREVSEKVILGAAAASDTADIQYDSRLFTKAAKARGQSGGDQVYDNPLFVQEGINTMYRPNFSAAVDIQARDAADTLESKVQFELASGKRGREGPVEFSAAENTEKSEEGESSVKRHRGG
ncbi:mRNA splicing protein PRP45 [Lachancea thermotolerans CBS 6340]|uniref:Pre-mRNA-processing protein 45 n=1 Tax=Lachancea thermotolerans (strain ATCC 56472 / CBS 6340 / NRRL Y-8284) TaxID=559295 RepID=C5DG26_LACTC|nr:KLTH0D01892p [Lachancea thermotolerans CBS 6340]CAR22368.1 KLTH0D01892p [Lachancea thermotolerans CBS 6340]